jgi:hypothetical protein
MPAYVKQTLTIIMQHGKVFLSVSKEMREVGELSLSYKGYDSKGM